MTRIHRAGALTRTGIVSVLSLALLGLTAPASGAPPTAASPGNAVVLPAATPTASSLRAWPSTDVVRPNETVHFRGRVYLGEARTPAGRGVEVVLMKKTIHDPSWSVVERVTTNANGMFTARDRPTRSITYRLKVSSKNAVAASYSERITVRRRVADRHLNERTRMLWQAGQLGAARTGVRSVRGVDAVYRDHARGMLVRVDKRAGTRTWLVEGKILKKYRKLGGPTGRLGVPVHDQRCGLLEDGCVQRFRGGTLYYSPSAGYSVAYGTGEYTEALAAGLSQRNYREPSVRGSKFNAWAGASTAWCAIFQSWMASASGHEGAVPFRTRFSDFVPALRAEARRVSKPRPGDLALFSFTSSRQPSHVGMVIKAGKKTLRVLDGNTTSGTGSLTRGVFVRERSKHYVLEYYRIDW
ncbi:hypothetical protein GCM10011331_25560 [Flavimobilis marinus]|uniref:LGFP repeat-containing protein n=1 Tax=Flavimobilis marinus TaxID=285351 RepID=A0A1I2HHQ3_9MICO|nr:hypothetical protein [Flavimobilis marinus]GHG57488.1 hypothetical protein GCM10011331_25560 [Flavimobilis marinus]SFF28953.1 LGFP repeat-containing protein [Flavimobilis marinus]